jgi:hypothetical protein
MLFELPWGSTITLPDRPWFANRNGLADTGVSLVKIIDAEGGRLKQVPSETPAVVKV